MEIIVSFILAWLCALSGVALGGWLVFKTKREGYESNLFQVKQPEGQAFNTDDGFGFAVPTPSKTELPSSIMDASDRFTAQFAESLARKVGDK